jgi:beta-xylosidase
VNRPRQLSLAHTRTNVAPLATGGNIVGTGGLYAPTIRYKDGTFYILCTIVTHRDPPHKSHSFSNFILKTKDIWSSQWSDPIYFDYYAFDPSLFFDDDGKAYIHGATMPGPKTTIDLFEIDLDTGEKLSEQKTIWTGITKFFPEGPHIYKKDGYYYCLIAEDGTHDFHAIKIARSKHLWGPYEAYDKNPILTAVGTDNYYTHLGHGDLFQDHSGHWWCVCLGVRKKEGRFALSRETFLTQVSWPEGEWPLIEEPVANPSRLQAPIRQLSVAGRHEDEILFIRQHNVPGYKLDGDRVSLVPSKEDLTHATGLEPISFAARRHRQLEGSALVKMHVPSAPAATDTQAGLAYFKDEHRFVRIFYDIGSSEVRFDAVNKTQDYSTCLKQSIKVKNTIGFRAVYTEQTLTFAFQKDEDTEWTDMGTVDTLRMSDFDFVGPVIGVFAFGTVQTTPISFDGLKVD